MSEVWDGIIFKYEGRRYMTKFKRYIENGVELEAILIEEELHQK